MEPMTVNGSAIKGVSPCPNKDRYPSGEAAPAGLKTGDFGLSPAKSLGAFVEPSSRAAFWDDPLRRSSQPCKGS
jgi:hypothetical protein